MTPAQMQLMLLLHHKPKTVGQAIDLINKSKHKHGRLFDEKA
jgi:hypothetical protein